MAFLDIPLKMGQSLQMSAIKLGIRLTGSSTFCMSPGALMGHCSLGPPKRVGSVP